MFGAVRLTPRGVFVVRLVWVMAGLALLWSGLAVAQAVGVADPVAGESLERVRATQVLVTVQEGDSLWGIARSHGPSADVRDDVLAIVRANNLTSSHVRVGQVLVVPAEG